MRRVSWQSRLWLALAAAAVPSVGQSLPAGITITASPNPATFGQPVTITAAVPATATGKVTFYDGATILGISPISADSATLTTIFLPSGKRSLRAHYSGDAVNAAANSPASSQTVVPVASLGFQPAATDPSLFVETSLATGDFNGDGKADLVVLSAAGAAAILLGNGDGTFQTGATYAPSMGEQTVVVGDWNGDGNADLALTTSFNNSVLVMLGNGDGTFQPAISAGTVTFAAGVVAGDFNGDGKADLAVTSSFRSTGSGVVWILLGNGDGSFQAPVMYGSAPGGNYSVAAGDMNGDGVTDLVVASDAGVSVLLGNGDGTFAAPTLTSLGALASGSGVALGDIDGDGVLDVIAGDQFGPSIHVLLGNGDGTLRSPVAYGNITKPETVALSDVNGDGKLDAIVQSANSGSEAPLYVLLGNGDGTFQPALSYSLLDSGSSLAVGDFNGDGKLDVATANGFVSILLGGGVPDLTVALSHANGFTQGQTGAFYTAAVSNIGVIASIGPVSLGFTLPSGLSATSISGAGWTCTLTTLTCSRSNPLAPGSSYPLVFVYLNIGNFTGSVTGMAQVSGGSDGNAANNTATDTTNVRLTTNATLTSSPNPAALGQQITLAATVSAGAGNVSFYDGTALLGIAALSGSQAVFKTSLLPSGPHSLTARYDGDLNFGPSVSPANMQSVNALLTSGAQASRTYPLTSTPYQVIVADVNNDGKPDILAFGAAGIDILLGNGDGTFQPARNLAVPTAGTGFAVEDMNADGKPDLIFLGSGAVEIAFGNGDGTFQTPVMIAPAAGYLTLVADLNRDGVPDIVLMSNTLADVYLGNGDGTFQAALVSTFSGGNSSGLAYYTALIDMNGDGILDVVAANPSSSGLWIYPGVGNGTFQSSPLTISTGVNSSQAMAAADFTGDGKPDVALLSSTAVRLFQGNGDGTLRNPVLSPLTNFPSSVMATGDFNGDGKLDFAYGASSSSAVTLMFGNGSGAFQLGAVLSADSTPFSIAIGDFNGDGRPDFVVATGVSKSLNVFLGAQGSGLTISSTHTGRFTAGATGAYRLTVSNLTYAAASGVVTVTDTLPSGFTATAISGTGWNCSLAAVACTRSDALIGGTDYPPITLTLNVPASPSPFTFDNLASVLYGGSTTTSTDPTLIVLPSATSLTVSSNVSALSQPVTFTASVPGQASGSVTFLDGGHFLGSAALSAGKATLSTRLLPAGVNSVTASYSGDTTYAPSTSGAISVKVMAGAASGLSPGIPYATGTYPTGIAAGDFNGDGKTDIVTTNSSASTVSVLLGRGDGSFQAKVDYSVGVGPELVAVGDFNGDGAQDLAVANYYSNSVSILLGNGDGTFQPAKTFSTGTDAPTSLFVTDLNQDGKLDLLIVSRHSGSAGIGLGSGNAILFLGNGDGTFVRSAAELGGGAADDAVVGDFNGDGKLDIVLLSDLLVSLGGGFEAAFMSFYAGNGDGTFAGPAYAYSGSIPISFGATVGDVNGDGILDVVSTGVTTVDVFNGSFEFPTTVSDAYVFIGNGDGTFRTAVAYPVGANPAAVALADVNGDGRLDIVSANNADGTISVLPGRGDGTFLPQTVYPARTLTYAIAVGDFNRDGRTDLAVANAGFNTVTVLLGAAPPVLPANITRNGKFNQ